MIPCKFDNLNLLFSFPLVALHGVRIGTPWDPGNEHPENEKDLQNKNKHMKTNRRLVAEGLGQGFKVKELFEAQYRLAVKTV